MKCDQGTLECIPCDVYAARAHRGRATILDGDAGHGRGVPTHALMDIEIALMSLFYIGCFAVFRDNPN